MRKLLPIILLAVLLGVVARFMTPPTPAPKQLVRKAGELRVHFLDVGQGDCILLETPDNRTVLVDAGDVDTADNVVRYLAGNDIDRIDLLVITHPHSDHIGGLPRVLEGFGVSRVVDSAYPHGSRTYREVLSSIDKRRIEYQRASEYPKPQISKSVSFAILWPPEGYTPNGEDGLNNASVVMQVTYGEVSFLLTGDIEAEAEGRLLASNQNLQSTVLKVAHHGGPNSTSNELLQVVRPEYAVISVGADNPYGHPARSILRRLKAAGTEVYRTDRQGTTIFSTDGYRMQVVTAR